MRPQTALVTGASSGIGEAFARLLSRRGYHVVLVARREDRLRRLAEELGDATVVPADLSRAGAAAGVLEALADGRAIDLLVNNAGVGYYEAFHEMSLERNLATIDLCVRGLTELTHAVLPGMRDRRQGGIIHVSSAAAFQPIPYGAVYAAAKAYVLSFSEAIAEEVRGSGVRVLCVCPGSTETEIHGHSGVDPLLLKLAPSMSPTAVAAESLLALERGETLLVPGFFNAAGAAIAQLLPHEWTAKIAGSLFRPRP